MPIAAGERKENVWNNSAGAKVSEGGGGGAPGAWAEIPLQLVEI